MEEVLQKTRTETQKHILVLVVVGLHQCTICTLLSLRWPLIRWTLCQNIQREEGGVDGVSQWEPLVWDWDTD